MRILFLCPSLEAGRDGVGDYTRLLARELVKQGHECALVALNDRHLPLGEQKWAQQTGLQVLRLPAGLAWGRRIKCVRQFLQAYQPDWVSLQFVPYGFQPKGLPVFLPDRLVGMPGDFGWHIMFHELWSGEAPDVSLKARIICVLQRLLIKRLLRKLRPHVVHTQLRLCVDRLRALGERPKLLPLFGNIPVHDSPGAPWRTLCPEGEESLRCAFKCGVFGAVHPGSLPGTVLSAISDAARRRGKTVIFIHFGRMGGEKGVETWNEAMVRLPHGAEAITLGPQPPEVVSAILQHLELGLASTPASISGKSGTVAAMRDHGLPIVFGAPDPFPDHASGQGCIPATFEGIEAALRNERQPGDDTAGAVASQFIADLETATEHSRALRFA